MTWFEHSANQTEAGKDSGIFAFLAVDMTFPSGHVRFWTGTGTITIGGSTYLGAGELGKVSAASDKTGLVAERKSYSLSATDLTIVPESEIDDSFGGDVTEYLGFIDTNTGAFVDTPEISWEGRIDSMRRVDGFEPAFVVNCEHRVVLLEKLDGWRYTNEHQQQFFSGDIGFSLVSKSNQREVIWGGDRVVVGSKLLGNHGRVYDYGPDD
jgi:hypothetical protein